MGKRFTRPVYDKNSDGIGSNKEKLKSVDNTVIFSLRLA